MFGSVGIFCVAPAAIHSSTLISDIVRFRNRALDQDKEEENADTEDNPAIRDSPLIGLCSCESKEFCMVNTVLYRKEYNDCFMEIYRARPERVICDELTPLHRKPVFIFVPAGGWAFFFYTWMRGGLHQLYRHVGPTLARRGYIAVIISHRRASLPKFLVYVFVGVFLCMLSFRVRLPYYTAITVYALFSIIYGAAYKACPYESQVQDIAYACKWVEENIYRFGGNPKKVYIGGHSTGGHLAALTAINPTFLKRVGLQANFIKGLVTFSAPFDLSQVLSGRYCSLAGFLWRGTFGTSGNLKDATPLSHLKPGNYCPPWIIIRGGRECRRSRGSDIIAAAVHQKLDVRSIEIPNQNHIGTVLELHRLFYLEDSRRRLFPTQGEAPDAA